MAVQITEEPSGFNLDGLKIGFWLAGYGYKSPVPPSQFCSAVRRWQLGHAVAHTACLEGCCSVARRISAVDVCVPSSLEELTPLTHTHTNTLFPLSPPDHPSLSIVLSTPCQILFTPDFPRRGPGGERAGMPGTSPHPPLRGADVSALLPGDTDTRINTFAVRLRHHRPAADSQTLP